MRGSLGELNPSRAVAKRMHELETELQQARMHLRRHSKSPDTTGRWGLEQPSAPEQEESWFITYLDMMTLLLVVMIVMLAFSGAIGARAGDEADTARPVASASATPAAVATAPVATALVGTTPPDTAAEPGASEDAAAPPSASVSADGTSASGSSTSGNTGARPGTGRSTVSPNAANRPPESSAAAADTATPRTSPGGTGLLPAGSGLLPGSSTLPNTAAVSETLPGWSAPQSATTALAHPADIGPLPRNAQPTPAGRPDSPLSTPAANSDESLYPGWSAADL